MVQLYKEQTKPLPLKQSLAITKRQDNLPIKYPKKLKVILKPNLKIENLDEKTHALKNI